MPKLAENKVPGYCHHKAKNLAYVCLDGRDIYLGKWNSPESKAEYNRRVGEWQAAGRRLPVDPLSITVAEIVVAYLDHSKTYYRRADGTPTNEVARIVRELKPLTKLYATTSAMDFGPLRLQAVRDTIVKLGWARKSVNHAVNTIKRCFKWAAANEMVPESAFRKLVPVEGLRQGRTDAPESDPIKPVPIEVVEATLPHLSPTVQAMVRLQLASAIRPGEAVILRTGDIDRTGNLWVYRPQFHKTMHRGHTREIYFGPRAQEILAPFLKPLNPTAYLFDPRDSVQQQLDRRHARRQTPLNQGNKPGQGHGKRRSRPVGERYTTTSYGRAIARACDVAFAPPPPLGRKVFQMKRGGKVIERRESVRAWKERLSDNQRTELAAWRAAHTWAPNQCRHTAATELRKTHGLEAAQVILGHRTLTVTQVYAEKNVAAAKRIVAEVG